MKAITTAATISHVGSDELGFCDCKAKGDELGEALDEGAVFEGVEEGGFGDCVDVWLVDGPVDCTGVEVGAGVGIGSFGFKAASGFGAVKKGVKVT